MEDQRLGVQVEPRLVCVSEFAKIQTTLGENQSILYEVITLEASGNLPFWVI